MTDVSNSVDPDADDLYDPDEDAELSDEETGTSTGTTTTSFGRTYSELPEGYVTAGAFVKVLETQREVTVKPQVIYAAAKNSKAFPAFHHTDGRIIVPVKEGLEWWDAKDARAAAPRSSEPTAWEKAQAKAAAEEGASSDSE